MPLAGAYRWGLLGLAAGVLVLGWVLRRDSWPVAVVLTLDAVLAGVSSVVPCTGGCPLPPYEPTTVADVVHTAASALGLIVLAVAMALVAFTGSFRPALRRLATGCVGVIVPLGAALGLSMLISGRGLPSAVLERAALVVAVSWLVGTSTVVATARSTRREPGPGSRAIVGA